MKINVSSENCCFLNYKAVNNASKVSSDALSVSRTEVDIKVTISEEGKKAYKNNLQDKEKTNYESMVANRRELLEKKNTPEVHYGFMLGNKLAELTKNDKEYCSIEDRGATLLEAYASIYDEIVQGYADGTREIYVEDEESESGYRNMTIQEEINGLDVAYQKYAYRFETMVNQSVDASKAFDEYWKKLSQIGVHRAEMATKAKEYYDKMREEEIPENISGNMIGAKNKFIELYSQNSNRNLGIRNLLDNIKIF